MPPTRLPQHAGLSDRTPSSAMSLSALFRASSDEALRDLVPLVTRFYLSSISRPSTATPCRGICCSQLCTSKMDNRVIVMISCCVESVVPYGKSTSRPITLGMGVVGRSRLRVLVPNSQVVSTFCYDPRGLILARDVPAPRYGFAFFSTSTGVGRVPENKQKIVSLRESS